MTKTIFTLLGLFLIYEMGAQTTTAPEKLNFFLASTNDIDYPEDTLYKIVFIENLEVEEYSWLKSHAPVLGIFFVSGVVNGLKESSDFHWDAFQKTFPGADPNWWNNDISWENKWIDGDPKNGERFPGSSTYLSFTTDSYHLLTVTNTSLLCIGSGLDVLINLKNGKKELKYFLIDAGANFLIRSAGFHLVYTFIVD